MARVLNSCGSPVFGDAVCAKCRITPQYSAASPSSLAANMASEAEYPLTVVYCPSTLPMNAGYVGGHT
ncbi:MAG: hypothetical protein EOO65_01345 [Methanosarcinales archaeon]|nr:MAG: hypothetical protein EOO65_01345 [Methanosarcinales archaeon]